MRHELMTSGVALFLWPLSCCAQADWAAWAGTADLGYQATTGNSQTSSVNAKFALEMERPTWKNAFAIQAATASEQGDSSAERYWFTEQYDWKVNARDYLFVTLEGQKDLFAGVRDRLTEAGGYGRRVLGGPVHRLSLELGAGASQLREADAESFQSNAVARTALHYDWKLSATSAFAETVKIEVSDANTYAESATELNLSIVGNLFAKLAYTVRHNSLAPAGSLNTDTFTAVSLSYQFGAPAADAP